MDEVRDVWVEYFLKQDEDEDEENKDVGMEITPWVSIPVIGKLVWMIRF